VQRIVTYDGDLEAASAGQSVTITLENEIDLSRGDMLVSPEAQPFVSKSFAAMLVWLHADAFELNRTYLLKQTSRQVKAQATRLRFRVNITDLTEHAANRLEMNEIACVEFEANGPLFFDLYEINRTTGCFILIDPLSNATVGAGMICEPLRGREASAAIKHSARQSSTITTEERARRNGHRAAVFLVDGTGQWAEKLESQLFASGFQAVLLREEEIKTGFRSLLEALLEAGLMIVCATNALGAPERSALRSLADHSLFELVGNSSDDELSSMNRALRFAEELRVAPGSSQRKD